MVSWLVLRIAGVMCSIPTANNKLTAFYSLTGKLVKCIDTAVYNEIRNNEVR